MSLVQINKIPPLRQSTEEMMACPKFYATEVIEGNHQPAGMDSARGTEIHRTMAAYLAYCALHGVSIDLDAFDRFSHGAGPQAARILIGLRDGFEVDHAHLFATELTLALDENFEPTSLAQELQGIANDSDLPAYHQGTLDGLYAFADEGRLRIDDFKSHAKPFDPEDKPQAKKYALFALKHFPWANEVTFRLVFARYKRVTREVTYSRSQLPILIDAARAARERQLKIHEDYAAGKEPEAIAGNHCYYCPLLSNAQCPIAKWNPNMQLTMRQRLNFNLFYAAFSRKNNAAMRAHVQETGRQIVLRDFNGRAYVFGPQEKEADVYPVFKFIDGRIKYRDEVSPDLPIIDWLLAYAEDPENYDDIEWMKNVVISSTSLNRYLKTNKRAMLDQAIEDSVDKVTKVRLRVSKPLDAVPEEEDEDDEDELEEEA